MLYVDLHQLQPTTHSLCSQQSCTEITAPTAAEFSPSVFILYADEGGEGTAEVWLNRKRGRTALLAPPRAAECPNQLTNAQCMQQR